MFSVALRFGLRPEAGFAGREAKLRLVRSTLEKEGVHGGTIGSPVCNARNARFLDVQRFHDA